MHVGYATWTGTPAPELAVTIAIVLAKVPSVISEAATAKRLLRNILLLHLCPAGLPVQDKMYAGAAAPS